MDSSGRGESDQPDGGSEKAVTKLMKNLGIENQKGNTVLSLSFEGQSPELAQSVLNKLVDLYLQKNITAHRARGSDELLDKQSEDLRTQPAKAEEELKKTQRSDRLCFPRGAAQACPEPN